jgi:carboxylesterase
MRPLGEALAARGFPVHAVRLAGHGTSVDDLARSRWTDWLASAEAGREHLAREVPRIAIAGMSMGALLALHLATSRPADVAALVLCGTPVTLAPRIRLLPWLARLPGFRRRYGLIPKNGGPDISDPAVRATSRSYSAMPLAAVLELLRLQSAVRAELARATQPALLLHGGQDHSVPVSNLELLRRRLGSRWIEAHVLARSWHVITLDVERVQVAALAGDFLARVEESGDY